MSRTNARPAAKKRKAKLKAAMAAPKQDRPRQRRPIGMGGGYIMAEMMAMSAMLSQVTRRVREGEE